MTVQPQAGLSRRQLLNILAAGGGLVTAATTFPAAAEGDTPFEGYSIFHETMVEMPWPDIEQAAKDDAIVLLPVAVVEEHGPHLGLGSDIYLTYLWAKLTRRALESRSIKTLIVPPYYWGINAKTSGFPGSFTVREETFKAVLYDIHASLKQWGFSSVFALNLHGDPTHSRVLQTAIKEAHDGLNIGAYQVCPERTAVVDPNYVLFYQQSPIPPELFAHVDTHAGAFETGILAGWFPNDVRAEVARTLPPSPNGFGPLGYWGDPASFETLTTEFARQLMEADAARTADAIEAFLKQSAA